MVINLTPHDIIMFKADAPNIVDEPEFTGWYLTTIPKSDNAIRLDEKIIGSFNLMQQIKNVIFEIPIKHVQYGHITNEPPQVQDTFYVVSLATALAVRGRWDFLVPYREVRNLKGTVIGCRALAKPC